MPEREACTVGLPSDDSRLRERGHLASLYKRSAGSCIGGLMCHSVKDARSSNVYHWLGRGLPVPAGAFLPSWVLVFVGPCCVII